ncbi:aminotransferase class I/II-fold pyridoxal phosphate-dependent enzyme [Terrilactibacillus sp. S3-3]|nr:aminotransferase class I/II-fold pyridoxal phosphate-dependent enzyme [Terrilactibacillus sp. S3-3]
MTIYERATRRALFWKKKAIADIENGEEGFACSSGMSAIQLVLSLFRSGDHLIASRDLYGGTYRLFEFLASQYNISYTYWDGSDYDELAATVRPDTKAIFIETPTNPLMKETDISEIAAIARQHDLLLIVDNTFYTPVIQKPLDEGADIVLHSATKYLGGHNDVLAGLVVSKSSKVTKKNCGCIIMQAASSYLPSIPGYY